MLDVEIQIRTLPHNAGWLVDLRSVASPAFVSVPPLTDADLAAVPDLPDQARSWKGFLTALSPGGSFSPSPANLRDVGAVIMKHILGAPAVARHLGEVELRAERERRPVRLLIDLEEEDSILSCLPLELAHDGTRFFFKRAGRPSFRIAPLSEARNLRLQRGSRVLVATAHADGEDPQPDRGSLQDHAQAVMQAVQGAGFVAEHLEDATTETLRQSLLAGSPVDLLYIVCHGIEDSDRAGLLVLRGRPLEGLELARWLEEAVERQRPVQAVVLCACSSAFPAMEAGTLGMAQWLARPGRALATLGFRGPVLVKWALQWSERLFRRLGEGAPLEDAFADARYNEPDSEPQWVLPILYARRRDPDAVSASHRLLERKFGAPAAPLEQLPSLSPPPIPRQPKPYFTGRTKDIQALQKWVRTPGAAQITSVAGEGGIGKSELATVLAHDVRATGRPVVWLERADRDVRGALGSMIALAQPTFQAEPEAKLEDLTATMRRLLGHFRGLLVLDDISERSAVDPLLPGGDWNVLVTTRIEGLLPGVREFNLEPLDPSDALRLLSQVAWNTEEPPGAERKDSETLIERLGYLPLAIELAGATLRNLVTPREYLDSLEMGSGVAVSDRDRVRATMLRSLEDLDRADELAFLGLGILPAPGAAADQVAVTLGQPEPLVARRLDRLVRYNLASWSPEVGRYRLHPLLREAARDRARAESEIWNKLHQGAAAALERLGLWVHQPIGSRTDLARERWSQVRDLFDAIDPAPWLEGADGGQMLAMALVAADQYRRDRTPADRERFLTTADALSQDGEPWRRGRVLQARGDLRRFRSDLDGAAQDYDEALRLFQAVESRLGQANVLQARGDLEGGRSDWVSALRWYHECLPLYREVQSTLGLSNVLAEIARVHAVEGKPREAGEAAMEAMQLATQSENRYAMNVAGSILEWLQKLLEQTESDSPDESANTE